MTNHYEDEGLTKLNGGIEATYTNTTGKVNYIFIVIK